MNKNPPSISELAAATNSTPAPTKELIKKASANTNQDLESLNSEVNEKGETGILAVIAAVLSQLKEFLDQFFGEETEDEKSINIDKWKSFKNTPLFDFFEEMQETFSLTQENTNPDDFNKKFEDPNFKKIMEFQKNSGEIYSPESLAILWTNKESLEIKNNKLVKKNGNVVQEIDTKNDKTISESIIPQESVSDRVPAFIQNMKASFTTHFNNIPARYKSKIPAAINQFEADLQTAISKGKVPPFTKERIVYSIESTISLNGFSRLIVNNKVGEFLASADGRALQVQYKDMWKA